MGCAGASFGGSDVDIGGCRGELAELDVPLELRRGGGVGVDGFKSDREGPEPRRSRVENTLS